MELINEELIQFGLAAKNEKEVIETIAGTMEKQGRLESTDDYVQDVLKREETSPTSIGFLIATPHAKSVHVKEATLAFARTKEIIEWAGEEVQLVFQIAVPDPGQGDKHLEILAKISRKIMDEEFREKLMKTNRKEDVLNMIM